jgi:predicted nucleic acid-binding protein
VDFPAYLADVSLVLQTEKLNISEALTIDRHFDVYRSSDGRLVRSVLQSG